MNRPQEVSGIILAGGKSSRMGKNKAELLLGGKTFLQWQVDKLRHLGVEEILLSGTMEALPGTRAIPDVYPERGPLGGLHACLEAAGNPCCLVITVDVPLISAETLSALLTTHWTEGGEVTVLSVDGQVEPLLAVYEKHLAGPIEELICEGSRPVRALLSQVKVSTLPYAGPMEEVLNCNTMEDYEALRQYDYLKYQ